MNPVSDKKGLGLIEAIIALAVILTGVISGLTLTAYNLNASASSEARLIAANLAREGLEVVRQLRDSNWLAGNPWYQDIVEEGEYRFTVEFDPESNLWATVAQAESLADCDLCFLYLDETNGVYSHNAAGALTRYQRLLVKREICWDPTVASEALLEEGEECVDYGAPLVGWQVESQVAWTDSSGSNAITLTDKIYDWR